MGVDGISYTTLNGTNCTVYIIGKILVTIKLDSAVQYLSASVATLIGTLPNNIKPKVEFGTQFSSSVVNNSNYPTYSVGWINTNGSITAKSGNMSGQNVTILKTWGVVTHPYNLFTIS